ncbi:Protein kinase domain-containing protein [Pleurotus pulmonarius]
MDHPTMSRSSSDSLYDYHYDYYNFYPSIESFSSNESSMSTPSKRGATGVFIRNRTNMDAALRADLADLITKDVDIEEYVRHVYGVSKDDIKKIKAKEWKLEGLDIYMKLLAEGAREEKFYAPFKAIMDHLFGIFDGEKLESEKSGAEKRKIDVHHASLGKTALKSVGNVRKPDQLFFFGSHNDKSPITWALTKAFVELAVTSSAQRIASSTIATINEEEASHGPAASAPDLMQFEAITTPSGGTKRRSTDPTGRPKPSKIAKMSVLSNKEPQAAGYALELLASTCRRWATGLVITDTQVVLHYYDRMGAIFTEPFKFDKEPWKLALFALAIGQCDLVQAGFEPLIASDIDTTLSEPLISLKNTILRLPKGSNEGIAKEGGNNEAGSDKAKSEAVVEKVWSHFKITGDPLYVYGGLTGRGSHVLPGDLVEEPPSQNRAEGVASNEKQVAESKPEGAMVVKLSWPMEKRPYLEANTIKDLVEKIPWMSRHLPRIHCAISLKGESMGLPRHLFRDITIAYGLEQRYFTLLFSDCYKHLWEVKTLTGFQMAFIDIVECHRAVTRYGKVLHRDISENNLLWTNDDRVVGVLNDWDLSTPVDAVGNSTNHRTGTGPFMAYDLLGAQPPVHLYRHDLESLFYVLIWAAVHYNLGSAVPYSGAVNPALKPWTGDYAEARMAKHAFLGDPEPVLRKVQPVFKPMQAKWIRPLCDLFLKAQVNRDILASLTRETEEEVIGDFLTGSHRYALMNTGDDSDDEDNANNLALPEPAVNSAPAHDIDFETLGCLTFESFMAALDHWKPRSIPKQYREYANRLLKEDKPPVVSESLEG